MKIQNLKTNIFTFVLFCLLNVFAPQAFASEAPPVPLLKTGVPADWWFVFKFNAATFPGCNNEHRACPFGGQVRPYADGQQYAYASNKNPALQNGDGCTGDSLSDPLGATFDEIYNGNYHFVVWNDQFYDDPKIAGCKKSCGSPWGHSKGILAWNDDGDGLVIQVSTPSWPAAGSGKFPRRLDGNSLGCVIDDDVKVSQHFFATKLVHKDVVVVVRALQNASVVTDPSNPQIVNNGGPKDIQQLVLSLGKKSRSEEALVQSLSNGIQLISKPSRLHVPPWQMVSALLDGEPLRVATWWATPRIPSTKESTQIGCWSESLPNPGPVEIVTNGSWQQQGIGLQGGPGNDRNHAKLGVSSGSGHQFTIFGDLNQQGALNEKCGSSQNGRGGLFFVMKNAKLSASLANMLSGSSKK